MPTYKSSYTGEQIDENLGKASSALQNLEPIAISGEATGGTVDTLSDTSQEWTEHEFANWLLILQRNGEVSHHTVQGNINDTLGFTPALGVDTEATTIVGSGESPEGQITLRLVDKGADGNDWELHLEAGDTNTGNIICAADVENKIITITVDTTGGGDPMDLMAGSLETAISESIPQHLESVGEFTAGNIPYPAVYEFDGGVDGDAISAGDEYWLVYQPTYEEMVTSADINDIVTITQDDYDALNPKVATRLYVIIENDD